MIHYHVWFSFKPEVSEEAGLAIARAYVAELTAKGGVARAMVLKNTGAAPKSLLPRYHALFEFRDDAQMDATFAAKRAEGIHGGPHGQLIASVAEFKVEVFREI